MLAILLAACGPSGTQTPADRASIESGGADTSRVESGGGDSAVQPAYSIDIGRRVLHADGRDTTRVTLRADAGAPAPVLQVDHGTLSGPVPAGRHAWEWTFHAGTWPSKATFRVADGTLRGETWLALAEPPAHSVQMHLHGSLSEGNGRMTTYIDSAERIGLDVLWWTDHDIFYFDDHFLELQQVDFEEGGLTQRVPGFPADTFVDVEWSRRVDTLHDGVADVVPEAASTGAYGLRLAGTAAEGSDWSALQLRVQMGPALNYKSLLADVTLGFSLRPHLGPDAELLVTVPMSQTPITDDDAFPERAVRFYLSRSDHRAESTDEVLWLPLAADDGAWSSHTFDLTTIAARQWPLLDGDLHGEFITVELRARNGASAEVYLDDLSWTQALTGDALRARQAEWLDRRRSDVGQHIGMELSELTDGHFNAFGSAVPFLPYADTPDLDAAAAVALVQAAGGLVAYNHMFGVAREPPDEEARAEQVAEKIDLLLANDAWGVDMLEVGYRERHAQLEDFLQVWDALGVAGRPITGIGTSDQHDDYELDGSANNFVTWIGAADGSEEALLAALRRGNAWFGDPTAFPDVDVSVALEVPAHAASMGQVVVGATGPLDVVFRAMPLRRDWTVVFIEDGAPAATHALASSGRAELVHTVDPSGGRLVRVEVHDGSGTPILLTNPVLFSDDGAAVPADRLPQR